MINASRGRTVDLDEHLAVYKDHPFRHPDEMFEAIFFLMAANCDRVLVDLSETIYETYCRSSRVTQRGCEELLTILVDKAFIPYPRKDTTPQEFQELAETFQGFRIELADRLTNTEGLRRIHLEIFQDPPDSKAQTPKVTARHEVAPGQYA